MKAQRNKLRHNWRAQSLEVLLDTRIVIKGEHQDSYLVVTCNNLHKKILQEFDVEDLRIMIGQSIGLNYLIPLAIEVLNENVMAEGDFYEGDLLKAVLTSDPIFWKEELDYRKAVEELFQSNHAFIKSFDTSHEIRKGLYSAFAEFEKRHN